MAHSVSALTIMVSIVAALNAAPTPMFSENHSFETVNVILEPMGTHKGAHYGTDVPVNLGCVEVQESILPTKLRLNTAEPEYYDVVSYESSDCNNEIEKLQGSTDIVLNDRYPICSFKLNLNENDLSEVADVLVTFYLKGKKYIKKFNNETALEVHDICNAQSGQHRFADRITVFSENSNVNEVLLFRESYPSNDPEYEPVVAGNATCLVNETLKQKKLVRSIKIVQNNE